MRRVVLMMLAVVSSNAMAEWEKIDGFRGNDSYYFDPTSITKNASRAQMLTLVSFGERQYTQTGWYVSAKYRTEYDCKKKKWRLLESHLYTESMGGGEAIVKNTRSTTEWMPILPGTPTELNMGIACGERSIVE